MQSPPLVSVVTSYLTACIIYLIVSAAGLFCICLKFAFIESVVQFASIQCRAFSMTETFNPFVLFGLSFSSFASYYISRNNNTQTT